jgi:xanthine dehydrogenase YagR molybdenum-binding subunit
VTQAPERTRPTTATVPAVGRPIDRVDGAVKTTGASEYTADRPYPDLVHATLVHATIARGRITGIDTAAAEAVDGVLAVITHRNAPALRPPATRVNPLDLSTMASGTKVNYLGSDEVHWNGEPVAVVVAETLEAAVEAARLVRVSYAAAPAVTDFHAAEGSAEPARGPAMLSGAGRKGDAEQALAAAPVSVDLRFTTPPQNHNAIEPHATTAVWDGDRLTVHESTQSMDFARRHLALRFGVPVDAVRVIAPNVGGGFGGKSFVWAGTVLCALAARVVERPVRLALSREAVFRTVGGRAPTVQRVALGAERDGALTALVHTGISQVGRVGGTPEAVGSQSRHLYAARTLLVRHSTATLDMLPNSAMRAPGEAVGTFALESGMDALAYELGMDPVELRKRNEPERDPLAGRPFTHRNLRAAYARGAQRFGWADRPPQPRSMRDGRRLLGWGVATAFHMPIQFTADVTVRLGMDGTVTVRCGLHEIGVGAATVQAQIAADALGVPVEAVTVEIGDSALPVGPMAGGSGQTATAAASVLRACEELRRSALALARRSPGSPLRGRRIDELVARARISP